MSMVVLLPIASSLLNPPDFEPMQQQSMKPLTMRITVQLQPHPQAERHLTPIAGVILKRRPLLQIWHPALIMSLLPTAIPVPLQKQSPCVPSSAAWSLHKSVLPMQAALTTITAQLPSPLMVDRHPLPTDGQMVLRAQLSTT